MPSYPFMIQVRVLAFFILLPFALPGQTVGQTQSPDELTELSLEELMDIKIVAASKKKQRISQVAASAFVITRDDIRRYGYRTLGESLRRISGLYLSSDRNYDYLGVRGFSLPGDYNTRILVLIDGHRVNNAIYDASLLEDGFPIDIESIEHIEVVKGPGSALWGSNALFAVVNVVPRKGSDMDGGRVLAETGSHLRKKGFVEYGRLFDNGLEIAGSVSGMDSDGENHIYFPELDQPGFHHGVAARVDDEDASKVYITLSYHDVGLMLYKSKRRKTVPTAAWDGAFNDSGTYTDDGFTSAELSYEKDLSNSRNGHFLARIYHDDYDYSGEYPRYDNGGWAGTYVLNKDEGWSRQWGAELRYGMDITEDLTSTFGVEYQDVYEIHQQNWDASPYYALSLDTGTDQNAYHSSAYYLQGEYGLLDNLSLIGGIRLDDYSTIGKQWNPRAALVYSPRLATIFKLLYGEAFRAPNDYERNYDDGGWQIGNDSLKPETIRTWELVCEQNIASHSRLVASIFRFELKNLISQVETADYLLQFQNNPHTVRSDGVEIQLESRFENGIEGYLGVSTVNTKDLDLDARLTNSPTFLASGGISVPIWSKNFYLSPDFFYVDGRKSADMTEDAGSYFLTNLTITSGNIFKDIRMSFAVYNLFNKNIIAPGAGEHYHYDPDADHYIYFNIPQEGRTFRFQLSCSF
ncbi:MAG: TonB-dependent receptor [Proteobacteria bacterium]|nr:TonB-dependent receptor [Pseudomonadota bacterium]MBU0966236.1 TonB-dependent receptor [Pseudomonadota bacterium]